MQAYKCVCLNPMWRCREDPRGHTLLTLAVGEEHYNAERTHHLHSPSGLPHDFPSLEDHIVDEPPDQPQQRPDSRLSLRGSAPTSRMPSRPPHNRQHHPYNRQPMMSPRMRTTFSPMHSRPSNFLPSRLSQHARSYEDEYEDDDAGDGGEGAANGELIATDDGQDALDRAEIARLESNVAAAQYQLAFKKAEIAQRAADLVVDAREGR